MCSFCMYCFTLFKVCGGEEGNRGAGKTGINFISPIAGNMVASVSLVAAASYVALYPVQLLAPLFFLFPQNRKVGRGREGSENSMD